MIWNYLLIVAIILLLVAYLLYKLREPQTRPDKKSVDLDALTFPAMTKFVKQAFHEMTNSNLYDMALSQEDFERRKNKRDELKRALKGCTSGDMYDKLYVKEFMFDLLSKSYGLNDQTINCVLPFDEPEKLTAENKFMILLHLFKKKHGQKALGYLIETYQLDRLKSVIEDGDTESYIITADEIDKVYAKNAHRLLSFEDKLQIVVQRIYQYYKGFGVVDEIREMSIDGVSGGVSGLPPTMHDAEDEAAFFNRMSSSHPHSYDSVWIMYRGKTMHLSFLSFGTETELRRVCQNIYKYNNPGQLTETNGFIVNDMKDGSRVVVMRPPFAESWAFFVRKFDLTIISLEDLLNPQDKPYRFQNTALPIGFLPFLMKGARVTAVTGDQGTGKSTLMMAMMKYIYGWMTLRIQEMAFELHLRKLYPSRNIVSIRQTDSITGQKGMDVQKKTDGAVNVIGEVATDEQAAWLIQAAQVASLFTVFSHHAKTFFQLIFSIRNSTIKTGMFRNETIAEQQVVDVIHFNVHLNKEADGRRYIERITECIPQLQSAEYSADFQEAAKQFFKRMTDRKSFDARDIIVYKDGAYVAAEPISERNRTEMMRHMSAKDRADFEAFLNIHWGADRVG